MAWIRIVISAAASIVATVITGVTFVFNGYGEEGSDSLNTLPFVIPWFLATVALTGLVIGAIVSRSRSRRYHWSWWALLLAFAMALVAVAVLPIGP